MGLLTPIDRVLQAGGTGVTLAFWLLAIVGAGLTVYGPLPIQLTPFVTGLATAIVWMRFQGITPSELLVRAGYTELRDERLD